MAIRYSKEIHDFIRENVTGTTTRDLAVMVNERFGTDFTEGKMKAYKSNHKLKSGTPIGVPKGESKLFPKEVVDYMVANYKGVGPKEMAEVLNKKFGTNYSRQQVKTYYHNHGLNSGLTCRFPKGHVPANKGRRGYCHPNSRRTTFKRGNVPKNKLPIGSERIRQPDGYIWVKVAEPNKWRMKQQVVWEEVNGPVPKGSRIIFLDGDVTNTDLSNLKVVTNDVHLVMMQKGLRSECKELTETGVVLATMCRAVHEKKKEVKDEAKQRGNGKA